MGRKTLNDIIPVILAGGAGTRLWPLSRKSFPKQFVKLTGSESCFQQAVRRVAVAGYGAPVVLTSEAHRFIVTEQLAEIDLQAESVLIEPSVKNTAPAILAAALHIEARTPDGLMLVMPSDHDIPEPHLFRTAVQTGAAFAEAGHIVIFGVHPKSPETGFGYLELPESATSEPVPLVGYVEKPDQERARLIFESKRYLWNTGIFLSTTQTILTAFQTHCPDLLPGVTDSVRGARPDLDFVRLGESAWNELPSVSFDYAVLEKAGNLYAVPYSGAWSDLGNWDSVNERFKSEPASQPEAGKTLEVRCENVLLKSDSSGQVVVGIGLKDIVAVATPDAVLVAGLNSAQNVKDAVAALQQQGLPQAEEFPRDHRPWGWFERLTVGNRFQVKKIVVNPGGSLSLQSHRFRVEHWIVVEGAAKVTIGEDVRIVMENQSVFIPLGAKHRLENPFGERLSLIEVQTGTYFGEDDITRYDDRYARK